MKQEILNEYLAYVKDQGQVVNYIRVYQDDELIAKYDRLQELARLNTWSVSKSFVSAGVGIALEEGLLTQDEKICDAFPEYVPDNADSFLLDTTVRHMLTMTTGLARPLFFANNRERYETQDWIRYFFNAEFDHAPGERFLYSNFNTYMLSCLIERRSGQFLADYLKPRLFDKIGILSPEWTRDPMGHCHAANGLYVTVEELARFGKMTLHEGVYDGTRVVSSAYLKEACSDQVPRGGDNPMYGYQFWINPDGDSFRADGKYGQYIAVLPRKGIVYAMQSLDDSVKFQDVWDCVLSRI